jgi:phytoene dehydrogenase-like protein
MHTPEETRTMDPRPIVVVGAGLAGLTAALEAAHRGTPVSVLDGSGEPGGRARSTRRSGYVLNLGPHGLATDGPGTAVLVGHGIALPGGRPAVHRAKLLLGDRLVGPLSRRHGAGGLRGLPGLAAMAAEARRTEPDGTVREWIARHVHDARSRASVGGLARLATYADDLDRQAADLMAEAMRGGAVRYLDGGWGALVDRLRAAAVGAGAEVRPGAAVRHVRRTADGGWQVATDDEVVDAAAVVLAAGGPADAARLLSGAEARTVATWAARAVPVRMAALDVALATRPAGPSLVLGVDEPLYLSVHSDHARLAPDGGAVVQVARYLPVGGQAPEGTRDELEALLDRVLPGWRAQVVTARYLPGLVVTHDGALAEHGGRQARPGPEVPGAPGLAVAGDWVGARGTLSQASIASAAAAASAAVARRDAMPSGVLEARPA